MLMLAALIIAPMTVIHVNGGVGLVWQQVQVVNPGSIELLGNLNFLGFISLMAWGLGYVGQPHILARFMAAREHEETSIS